MIHDFQERLLRSHELSDEPAWVDFYRRLWPDLLMCIRIDANSKFQKWGIDREVLLPNGRRISIDEKKRDRDYGDLLIEEWSVGRIQSGRFVGQKIGWSLDPDKRCDFVAYAVCEPGKQGKCYLLPFELTRQTCLANLDRWKRLSSGGFPAYPKDALNNGYVTRNCAVEWAEFKRCLNQQMLRQFGSQLELPAASSAKNQMTLEFEWGVQ
jgi:hypothetical protein